MMPEELPTPTESTQEVQRREQVHGVQRLAKAIPNKAFCQFDFRLPGLLLYCCIPVCRKASSSSRFPKILQSDLASSAANCAVGSIFVSTVIALQ